MRIGVIGAGSWGTALAKLLAENGHEIDLWSFEEIVVTQIREDHINHSYLPTHHLLETIRATADLEEACKNAEVIVSVSPSHCVRGVMKEAGKHIGTAVPIISATKGIENETLMTVSEILEDVLPIQCHPFLAYLSGPSFSKEVAQQMPTAVVIASFSEKLAVKLQDVFFAAFFRTYRSIDVIGVEMGGALKNVIAIAAGAASGMGLGYNSLAGMITRGLNEITRLAVARGANPLTLMGLAGMGDLWLTCTGPLSRNRTVGTLLGEGKTLSEILAQMTQVAEGVKTARSVFNLSKKLGVEMPISEQVFSVLYEDKPVQLALRDLLARELKRETNFFSV